LQVRAERGSPPFTRLQRLRCQNDPKMSDSRKNQSVRIGSYTLPLPRSRILRIVIGVLLMIGGLFSFLPILGVWMIPLGMLVLSVDVPVVRRWRRRFAVWLTRRHPKVAAWVNPGPNGSSNGNGAKAP
jgi:hypothetical protein